MKQLRVLVNASTLNKGGALQAAVSFIQSALADKSIDWCFVLSKEVATELERFSGLELKDNPQCWILNSSPARSVKSRVELLALERQCKPVVVFTFFGPAYVKFQAIHLCGVADGWVTHATPIAFSTLNSFVATLKTLLLLVYKAYWYRQANAWVVEAACAKNGLIRRLKIKQDTIYVVPNSCAAHYLSAVDDINQPDFKAKISILCLSAYYAHKNLEIIPQIAFYIHEIRPELAFEFVLTLPETEPGLSRIQAIAERLKVGEFIKNIGPVSLLKGPEVYQNSHMSILPSVLETFSANYPEAMAMGRPMLTSDLDFARDICGDAACYFKADDARDAANQTIELIENLALREQLIANGKRRLKAWPAPSEKYAMYKEIIHKISGC